MLEAREALSQHQETLEALTVDPVQQGFVASNAKTFRQWPHEKGAEVFGLWDGSIAVGLMACIDLRKSDELTPEDDPETAYLWRLMIAKDQQRKGYGRAALALFENWASARGLVRLETSVVPGNTAARKLYTSFGFLPTGRVMEGEDVLIRPAAPG